MVELFHPAAAVSRLLTGGTERGRGAEARRRTGLTGSRRAAGLREPAWLDGIPEGSIDDTHGSGRQEGRRRGIARHVFDRLAFVICFVAHDVLQYG